eukprot:6486125-Amphidinium_carterae.2
MQRRLPDHRRAPPIPISASQDAIARAEIAGCSALACGGCESQLRGLRLVRFAASTRLLHVLCQ